MRIRFLTRNGGHDGMAGSKRKSVISSLLSGVMLLSLIMPEERVMAEEVTSDTGVILDQQKMEIGPGATYTWKNMKLDRGLEKLHYVEFNPKEQVLELQPGKTDGKIYGMQGVTQMASDADQEGNRVIAAINGDFYDMSNGLPLGLFMGDGELLNNPPNDWLAFGMRADGSTIYGPSPKLTRTVNIGGKESSLTAINRLRSSDALVLYTPSFYTSTVTNALGDEVVLDILSGEVKSGQTLKLKVHEIHKDKGNTPITEGKVILSASGKHREILAGLKVGDEIKVSLELEAEWKDVKMAIGGQSRLIANGEIVPTSDPAVYPRTAIGTKADGSIIMLVIDGRQPGFSEGVTLTELSQIMKEMGAVDALNLDGGGSATFVARMPGETTRKVMNSPSDGGERRTANGILLVNKAPEGTADKLVVKPPMERVLAGSTAVFKAGAVDSNMHPARLSSNVEWSVTPDLGTFDGTGVFSAGSGAGMAEVKAVSGSLSGTGTVEVVDELTELNFGDTVKSFAPGQSETLEVTALRNGQIIQADNNQLEWRTEGDIGTIDDRGTFTAVNETEKNGKIIVGYKGIEASVDVNIGLPPVILEDFENGLDAYQEIAGAQYNSVRVSIENDEDLVRFGNNALKLEYDFTGKPGTSGAYLQTKSAANNIVIPGYPEKISMWVYGDGKKHWLRAQMRDSKGAIPLNFVDESTGVDFEGWKYLEADVPKGRVMPLTMDMPVRYMETSAAKKDAGVLYVDQIRALYGPNQDDMNPPVLKELSPVDGTTVPSNQPKISVIAEDADYDPNKHPGTTLIDPDKIRFYLDGKLVEHTLYPPKGEIHYTPLTPLADGVHQVKVSVKDLSGNQTIKVWTFSVDTGSSKVVYSTPKDIYAGGTYTLDLSAVKPSDIRSGEIEFAYDPAKLENLELVRGEKLSETQLQAEIDSQAGRVILKLNDIHTAGLTDKDSIGQIQYRVKKDAVGTHTFEFTSGSISFVSTGDISYPFFGLPQTSEIRTHLSLEWNEEGQVEGYETTFQVKDESGAPLEGAEITADGVPIGVTNSDGILRDNTLTSAVKTYKLQAVKGTFYSPIVPFTVSKLFGTKTPYNINVSMGEEPTKSRGFTWHTNPGVDQSVVELVEASEFTDFNGPNVTRIQGENSLYQTLDIGTIRVHKAMANGLKPGTDYIYRVGDGHEHYSAQGTFKTAEVEGDHTKFLYFADSQGSTEADFKLWGNTVRKAIGEHPDSEFIYQAGDMVDKGFNENQWNLWFREAQDAFLNTTLVGAIGNHEVMGTKGNSDFLAHFNQPGNGVPSLQGTNFSFDYKDAHFIVLNSEYQYEEQKEWLEQDLAKTTKKWKIAMFHRGPYGSIYDTVEVRNLWAPVLEKYNVDLVLNGHDHMYLRTHLMKDKLVSTDGQGTTYVIAGSSGSKFYSLTARDWQKVTDEEQTQMYASVEIMGDELRMLTKTVSGRVVDEFTLSKNTDQPESIEIEQQDVILALGESKELTAAVKPDHAADKTVTWSVYSSDPEEVVTISAEGMVTAKGLGTAVVRATSNAVPELYAETTITVDRVPEGEIESLELQGKSSLKVGETNQTVTEAVYEDGTRIRLLEGVVYDSSAQSVASIDDAGLIRALSEGTTLISATYGEFSASYDLTVLSSGTPDPDPGDGGGNTDGENPGSGGGGGSTSPAQPPTVPVPAPEATGKITVSSSELAAMIAKGEVVLTTKESLEEVLLPGNAASLLKEIPVTVNAGNVALTIPAEVLRALSELIPADQREGSTIRLSAKRIMGEDALRLIAEAADKSGAVIGAASDLLSFSLSITTKDGKTTELSTFTKPITIHLPVKGVVDRKLTGIYSIAADGGLEFVGGTWNGEKLTTEIHHFSTYAALHFNKKFTDVPEGHWAAHVIQELSAKQFIKGINDDQFAPAKAVTRAEFTAMLVRVLGLQLEGNSHFEDVASDAWYAGAVAAAAKAGIANGVSSKEFSPNAVIKRQEMAAMAVRAYQSVAVQQRLLGKEIQFKDVKGSPIWVQEAVQSAYVLGLVKGISDDIFRPQGITTRAESAQVIYNLLKKLPGYVM
ncbi:phosphodiester glycosidase family protein [Paenibacillus sp. EC2-1]|uniref:phosphodiester glycosidase family protein n=1 Tax=Paenibacillus sp. EC2-1 TaxID=3388665 RepID=UPI003BEEBB85